MPRRHHTRSDHTDHHADAYDTAADGTSRRHRCTRSTGTASACVCLSVWLYISYFVNVLYILVILVTASGNLT